MAPGTRGATHCPGFTNEALKVVKLLAKLNFTEEDAKSIVGDGFDSREELENLDDNMCKSFIQNCRKPVADHKVVVTSNMAEVFLKLLVWGLHHMKHVSRNIDINTIVIEWCHGMNDQNKLEANRPKTLSEKDYPKANLGNVTQTFEDIIDLLRKICGSSGIFLE